MLLQSSGARGRSGPTSINQRYSGGQPCSLTDGNLRSSGRTVSNLFNAVPSLGIQTVVRISSPLAMGKKGKIDRIWAFGPRLRAFAGGSK